MTDRRRHGLILLLVAGLIAASVAVIATNPTRLGLDLSSGVELVYKAQPTRETPVITPTALQRAVNVMNNRVNQLGVSQPQITTDGKNLIDVQLPDGDGVALACELAVLPWRPNVVLTSSNADITTSEEVRNAGARAFVHKSDLPNAPWSHLLGGD